MFKIAVKQEQYLTYILTDEAKQVRLELVPERGGMVTRWRIQGQNILYFDEERFANPQLSVRGGIPILFPICGNLPQDTYTYQNRSYQLKQHGFARDLPWEVTHQTANSDLAQISLKLKSNKQTLVVYPFQFELLFTYTIQGNNLIIEQQYTNHSEQVMPFSVGWHPYFWVKQKSQLQLTIPANTYQNQQTKTIHPFAGSFDFREAEIDVAFTQLQGHSTSLADPQRRLQITLNYSDLYSTLVFWTVAGKDYVCLEPWSAPRNALNTQEKLSYLEPGNSLAARLEMRVSYF